MTTKEARSIVEKGLKFGDAECIQAVELLAHVENPDGPGIVCTCCQEGPTTDGRAISLHKIGCYLCEPCGAKMDMFIDDAERDIAAPQGRQEPK